ncbi:copper chaperone PCu(A)C [Permianibacter aggregans]|uniref:Copper(I)-binding protein n=1 Tax=Permianibacter aggregans TaxID=1510150 RepID=A0A4R6UQA1_9GAMM|nr:copper chaperone PCu(A)C [Permianibacter aggregans]TDQ48376.1 hypothetical protein EV696_107112 [Permianibacter aggregans]
MRVWLLALLFCCSVVVAEPLIIRDAYVPLPPPGAPAAAYFTLINEGETRRLVDVDSPQAGMTMLHESIVKDGAARMQHVDYLELKKGEVVALKPGGLHVMLMRLKSPLKVGDQVQIELQFADESTQMIQVPVIAR